MKKLIKEAEDECIVEAKDVLRELAKVAFSNGSDFAKVIKDKGFARVEIVDTDTLPADKRVGYFKGQHMI